ILVTYADTMFVPSLARAQNSGIGLPDGRSVKAPAAPDRPSPHLPTADNPSAHSQPVADYPDSASHREGTWRSLPKDFLQDQKDVWLFPMQLAKGNHWAPTLAVTGATAGLILADPHVMPYFQTHT